jgi:hypothetical protein
MSEWIKYIALDFPDPFYVKEERLSIMLSNCYTALDIESLILE